MGPQPPSLPHTGASRRARRSPFADKTKGVWCRLPPQLLSRSSYAWFWPSFYWKLPIHSAARFSAAPDTETRFPCLRPVPALDIPGTMSGPKGTPRKYQGGPSSCAGDALRGGMGYWESLLGGGGDCRRMGPANKLQFPALLWPPCAKSGTLFLHGGQRESGIPEPHEPGHIRERLKEVRATHARAKKSEPLNPPCPNRSRWRAARSTLVDAQATTPGGAPPNTGAGTRCRWPGGTGRANF